ncbi:MAG: GTP-binding protein [Spirulina sp. DLM2.Bin59]|nr:MAG: GTP-binding protein [Spirulina sp. DLM2.Bin59]
MPKTLPHPPQPGLYLVAGPPGGGKTHWIREQLLTHPQGSAYGSPSQSGFCLDLAYLESQTPIQTIDAAQLVEVAYWAQQRPVYLELGFHVDLAALPSFPEVVPCSRIAILPPGVALSEWHSWADDLVVGMGPMVPQLPNQVQKSSLTGEVFDPASLDVVWHELTHGAYGRVQRAKGLFNLADGSTFWFSFNAGQPSHFEELPRPRCLTGRPAGLSGIEVMGWDVDAGAIAASLTASCLSDELLHHHQAQLRDAQEPVATLSESIL